MGRDSWSPPEPKRLNMSPERKAITHKFVLPNSHKEIVPRGDGTYEETLVDVEGYVTAGVYPDGRLGEVFLTIGKQGGLWKVYECLMIAVSVGLQYGIPLSVFAEKFEHLKFEPRGMTKNKDIPMAHSVVDYLFKWLQMRFPGGVAMDMADVKEDENDGSSGCKKTDQRGESETSGT